MDLPGQQQSLAPRGWYYAIKRGMDISFSIPGLFLLTLVLPLLALLIFLEDGGPIFYTQERLGRHGQRFKLYKFRTMIIDAETYLAQHPTLCADWQTVGKLQHDPRITRVGIWLRRSSLDELPQMFNILRGEMSLIGPRAIQSQEQSAFGTLLTLRHLVRPGLTGLWQVTSRSQPGYEQRAILDSIYVMECSLRTDLLILLKTVPVVLLSKGAY